MATPRRNGQLSSCEPCRISKLRCDHTSPACGRCVRGGRSHLCVYHPAPMSRPKPSKPPAAQKPRKRLSDSVALSNARGHSALLTPSSLPALSSTVEPRKDQHFADWCRRETISSTPGFLGLTSHTAIFREGRYNLPIEEPRRSEGPWTSSDLTGPDRSQIEQGAHVLLLLEHISLYRNILESPYNIPKATVIGSPVLRRLCESFEELYQGSINTAEDRLSAALKLSERIFENTSTPIVTNASMTFTEYISRIAHRWEAIGMFFCRMGMICRFIPSDDAVFQQEGIPIRDKKGYYALTIKVSSICLQICDRLGLINDPLCWLTLQSTMLLSHTYGMGDHCAWQSLGDLTTILFALGYHQLESDENVPFFLTELRKRVMVSAYCIDKELATFLGRPPRICQRYCDLIPPFDLTYDEIVADSEERDAALAKLSEDGRNPEGFLISRAWPRLFLMLNMHKENILELSLNRRTDNIVERVEKLIGESLKIRAELPPCLLLDEPSQSNLEFPIECIHLEFIYLDFLLYRTLFKRTGNEPVALIHTSLEIINMLHIIIAKLARSRKMAHWLGTDLYNIGMPAAAVLTIELLRCSQPRSQSMLPSSTQLSRSEIIHKLSLFVLNLETFIWPGEGDYEMAKQAATALRNVLDRVLCPEPVQPLSSVSPDSSTPDLLGGGDMPLVDETDFMVWLENADWGQESWLNYS